jgi:hypothetical protein
LGLDKNGTHQILAYVDDVNLIGYYIRTIEEKCNFVNMDKDIDIVANIGES